MALDVLYMLWNGAGCDILMIYLCFYEFEALLIQWHLIG